jgi:hypothetical protein
MDISKLNRKEKIQLVQLMEEKQRRLREKSAVYSPHRAQREVHASRKKIRAVFSGNGSGKTAMGTNELIWGAQGYNPIQERFTPVPCRGIVLLDNPSKVEDVWLPELQKWTFIKPEMLEKRGKPHISAIVFPNGSEVIFMSHGQDPLLFESIEADWIICDEPPPRAVYMGLMRGLRKKHSDPWILLLGTPITAAWMRKEIYEPWAAGNAAHIECFKYSSDENKENLNWDMYQNVFFKGLSEKEVQIRRHGEFFDLEGLALAHLFNRTTHVIPEFHWNQDWPCVVAIDPHPAKNHIACLVGVDRDGYLYYLKELSSSSPPQEFARELRNFYQGYRITEIICDSLGATPGTGGDGNKSFLDVLKENGVRARSTNFQEKNDENFIQSIQQILELPGQKDNFGRQLPKLRIVTGNKGIIGDLEQVEWTKYRNIDEYKPKLNITNRDYLACLKYALSTNVSVIPSKRRVVHSKNPSPWGAPKKKSFFTR